MKSEHVGDALLAFQLGGVEEPELIEAHLSECRECLGEFFAVKRQVEGAAAVEERPSELARKRLRADLIRALRPPPRIAPLRVLTFGAAVAAMIVAALLWVESHRRGPSPSQETLIDSAVSSPVAQVF